MTRSRMSRTHTVFEYLYRDASNFRKQGSLLLDGQAAEADVETVRARLDAGTYFVAEQVGVPSLRAVLAAETGGLTDDDHSFHEFVALRPATAREVTTLPLHGTVRDLVSRFDAAREWDLWLGTDGLPWARGLRALRAFARSE